MLGLGMFIVPLLFVGGLIWLILSRRRAGLGLALIFFALSVAAGYWAITRSRSSTAAIGILFLPFYGAVAGALGWAGGVLRRSETRGWRPVGWVCLLGAAGIVALLVAGGFQSMKLNERRDTQQLTLTRAVEAERAAIRNMLQLNSGREAEVLNQAIADRMNDRAFLIAALESPFVSADRLDQLADSKDLGMELQVARNPNCRGATLARLYRTSPYPAYLYQALAAHPRTPPDILRDIYSHRQMISGLDQWFVKNPATPNDILDEIAHRSR